MALMKAASEKKTPPHKIYSSLSITCQYHPKVKQPRLWSPPHLPLYTKPTLPWRTVTFAFSRPSRQTGLPRAKEAVRVDGPRYEPPLHWRAQLACVLGWPRIQCPPNPNSKAWAVSEAQTPSTTSTRRQACVCMQANKSPDRNHAPFLPRVFSGLTQFTTRIVRMPYGSTFPEGRACMHVRIVAFWGMVFLCSL